MEITARDSPFSFDLILLRHISYMIPVGNYFVERIEMHMAMLKFFIALICIMSSLMEGRYIFVFLTRNKYGLIASNLV